MCSGGCIRSNTSRTIRAGAALFELVERGILRIIKPPSALLLQNKATLAIIWELAGRGVWFDADERELIARYFLPTFLDPPDGDALFVRKPVYGREGSSIAILCGDETIAASSRQHYRAQPMVYQKFVDLPQTHGGRAVATCFVVGGEPSAVGLRIGGAIADIDAAFIALAVAP